MGRCCSANAQHRHPRVAYLPPWCWLARELKSDPFPSREEIQATQAQASRRGPRSAAAVPQRVSPRRIPTIPCRRAQPIRRPCGSGPAPQESLPPPEAAGQHGWAVWVAAAAVGAMLGMAGVLWTNRHGCPTVG